MIAATPTTDKTKKASLPRDTLSPEALATWRLLRDQGGYWTSGEVGRELLPTLPLVRSAQKAGRWLLALRLRQHVAESPTTRRLAAYGVTGRCVVPAGEQAEPEAVQ